MPLLAKEELPIEAGVQYGFAHRHEDTFSRGMKKFRTSFNPKTQRITQVDPFLRVQTREYFFRAGVFDSPYHLLGFQFGKFMFKNTPLYEIRSDLVFTSTSWSFRLPYFMFTYHYVNTIPGRWNRKLKIEWEGGAGFGFITGSKWNIHGYSLSPIQNLQYNINQRGRLGNIGRLDLGIRRTLWQGLHMRMGLSATYTHVGNFDGEINNGEGTVYFTRDGSLIPLTSIAALSSTSTIASPNNNFSGASLIKSKAIFNSGFTEFKIGVGYRF